MPLSCQPSGFPGVAHTDRWSWVRRSRFFRLPFPSPRPASRDSMASKVMENVFVAVAAAPLAVANVAVYVCNRSNAMAKVSGLVRVGAPLDDPPNGTLITGTAGTSPIRGTLRTGGPGASCYLGGECAAQLGRREREPTCAPARGTPLRFPTVFALARSILARIAASTSAAPRIRRTFAASSAAA